ncbi:UNVERIFIED_CONTAM: hypothetical protein HHA_253350 [Hammondia hammondi]|eukprot:XP_008884955.1 hypothetical protein HHA_253350 [Hammondia hammondi]
MDRLGRLQKSPIGIKCADWEAAALNSQRNSSSRSLKEILELQNISFHAPSTDARLHESRGQMHEVDQALARHKEYYAKEEEQFRVKEAQLKEKEAQLQLQLNRFNKFVDTNEDKRRRAEKRAAAEREIIKEKEKTIATLKVTVEQMEAKEQKLEAGVKRYKKYKEFLAAVMHVRDEFQEISDMMSRYDLLQSVNGTLVKKETDVNRRADKIRSSYQMYKKQAANAILEKSNTVAALQRELEMCEKERNIKQGQAEELLSHASEEALHFGQLLLCIDNLFRRCTEQRPNIQHANHLVKRLLRRQVTTPDTDVSLHAALPGNAVGQSGAPQESPSRPALPSGDGGPETSNGSVAKSSVNMVVAPLPGTITKISGKTSYAAQSPKKAESALETPRPARGKTLEAKQAEKSGNAEEQDGQKQLCDDAVQMLGVIASYAKDFRDICDTLTKNVVEFVTLRDVYAMKGSGSSVGGAGSSDALSSGSSRRFMSRTRDIGAFTDKSKCIVLGTHARHCVIHLISTGKGNANLAASLCAETSAVLPGKNGGDRHADAASWSDVSERERRQREVVSELLRTIPVYAVVSTETQQLVPAVFPSQEQVPRDEVVLPHPDHGRATASKRGKKPSRRKELEKLLYQEFQALTSLEERGGVGKARGLVLFFLSHRDAQVYLQHVQSQTAETALPVTTAKRPPSLAVVTTSLAKVYPLLLPPHPTDLPAKLAAWSREYQGTCGGSHVGPGEKSAFSVGRALFGWRNMAGTQGPWVDESEAQELVSRFVLVPDIAQLDTLLEDGGAEAVVVGTPLFFVSRSPEIPWSLLLDGRAPSASGAFPLYLNRRDAEQALSLTQKTPDGQPSWRNLGRRPLTVQRTSLEAFLEAFAEKSAVSVAPSPFLLVPAFDSFLRSEKERQKTDEQRQKGGFSVVGPFRRLVASSPTLRYLDWRKRKFIRDWLLPLFRRDRGREGDGHHIGDLLPEDA